MKINTLNYISTNEMKRNGSPDPVFYTDEDKTLFLVTLPCHPELKETKSVSKSVTKLTREDVNEYFSGDFDFQTFSKLLDNDLTDVVEYVRERIRTKSVTKSVTKLIELIEFLKEEKSRDEILSLLEIGNQTKNFKTNIQPLIDYGIIELMVPDKPKSPFQRYRLTEKGRKLIL